MMNMKRIILSYLRMERHSVPLFLKAVFPYLSEKPLFRLFYRAIEVLMSSALVLFLVIRADSGWGEGLAGAALLVLYTFTFLLSFISIQPETLKRNYHFFFYRMSRTSDASFYRSVLWEDVAARWLYHLPSRLPFMVGSIGVVGMRAIPLLMLGDSLALVAYMYRATRGMGGTAGLQTLRTILTGILERGIVGLFAYGMGVLTVRFLEIVRGAMLHRGISFETWHAADAAIRSEGERFLEAFSLLPSAVTALVEGPMWIGALLFVPGLVFLAVFYSTRFQIEPAAKTFRLPRLIVERCLLAEGYPHRSEGIFVLDRLRLLRLQDRLAQPWWMWGVPTNFIAALAFVLPILQLAHNPYARAFLIFIVFFIAFQSVVNDIRFDFQDVFYYRSDLRRLPLYHLLGVERPEAFLRSKMELLSCLVRHIAGVPLVILGTVAFIFLGVRAVILGVVAAFLFRAFLKGAVFWAASIPYRKFLLAFHLKEFRLRPPEEERIEDQMFQFVVDYPQRVLVYASIFGSLIVAMFGLVRGTGWLVYGLAFFGIWTLFLTSRYRDAFEVNPEREKRSSLPFWLSSTGTSLLVFGIGVVGGFAVSGGLREIIGDYVRWNSLSSHGKRSSSTMAGWRFCSLLLGW